MSEKAQTGRVFFFYKLLQKGTQSVSCATASDQTDGGKCGNNKTRGQERVSQIDEQTDLYNRGTDEDNRLSVRLNRSWK